MGVSSSLPFTRHLYFPQTHDDQVCSFSYRALIGSCRCNSPQPGTEHWRPWSRCWSQCQYWNTQSTTKLGRMGSSYWAGTMGLAKPATSATSSTNGPQHDDDVNDGYDDGSRWQSRPDASYDDDNVGGQNWRQRQVASDDGHDDDGESRW